jgi:hypothetical protein
MMAALNKTHNSLIINTLHKTRPDSRKYFTKNEKIFGELKKLYYLCRAIVREGKCRPKG